MAFAPRLPRLIPVLDVKAGLVVRAVAGRREHYRPLISQLTPSTDPGEVAQTLIETTSAQELYVADLDAIGTGHVSPCVLQLLTLSRTNIWIDAGFGPQLGLDALPNLPHIRPVIGLETCHTPTLIHPGPRTVAFSIDLYNGILLDNWRSWGLSDSHDIVGLARQVIAREVHTLIVLDLARVGTGSGCGTEALLRAIRAEFPEVELIAGGGVRSWDDVDRLAEAGADAVLVASALHDQTLRIPRG
jgi:phosphoribosylformimino-5-aminoimidazole carboxamide ribotide isomerase